MLWIIRALFIIIGIVSGTIVSGTSGGIIAFFAVAILIGIEIYSKVLTIN